MLLHGAVCTWQAGAPHPYGSGSGLLCPDGLLAGTAFGLAPDGDQTTVFWSQTRDAHGCRYRVESPELRHVRAVGFRLAEHLAWVLPVSSTEG